MNKPPFKTAGGNADSFLAQMKEFYETKERRERTKPKSRKPKSA